MSEDESERDVVALIRLPASVLMLLGLGFAAIIIALMMYYQAVPWFLSWLVIETVPEIVIFCIGLFGISLGLIMLIKRVN